MARLCRRQERGSLARPGAQPGEHGHRCRRRRPGSRVGADSAGGVGLDRRPPRVSLRRGDAGILLLLDRLLESGGEAAENRGVQQLAAGRSGRGCTATQAAELEVARRQAPSPLIAWLRDCRLWAGAEFASALWGRLSFMPCPQNTAPSPIAV